MTGVPDIFRPCGLWRPDWVVVPLDRQGIRDCVSCAAQYHERVCPIFRARFLRLFGLEVRRRP